MIQKHKRFWNSFTRIIVSSPFLLFVLGYAVVFLHLGSHQIIQPEFARGQYIIAGILLTLPIAICGATIPAIVNTFNSYKFKKFSLDFFWPLFKNLSYIIAVFFLIIVSLAPFAGGLHNSTPRLLYFIAEHWLELIIYPYTIVILLGTLYVNYGLIEDGNNISFWTNVREYLTVKRSYEAIENTKLLFVITLVYFIIYISAFTKTVYPEIPASIGGGEPIRAKFILKESSYLKQIYDKCLGDDESIQRDIVNIILTTNSSYFIICKSNKQVSSMEIMKREVKASKLLTNSQELLETF